MIQTTTPDERMAARYGTDRATGWPKVLVVAVVVIYLAVAVWAAVAMGTDRAEGNALSWQAGPKSVAVELEIRTDRPGGVTCAVKATDDAAADVGYRVVTIEGAPATVVITIPTVVRASSVTVLGCVPEGDELNVPPPDFPPGVAIP